MKTIASPEIMQAFSREQKLSGKSVALVPTMGYLHEGHLSLIRHASETADVVVVSVFVNPTQFGPGEDLDSYPRDQARDVMLCTECGANVFFVPDPDEVYLPSHSVYVEETALSAGLCGASRPSHFRGVTTVVCKLFNMVLPDVAVFGQKDAQQARIIQRMTRDLNFPVDIVIRPTVREPDGLALSSRNAYLSPEQRTHAVCLNRALDEAVSLYNSGERDTATLIAAIRSIIEEEPEAELDYVEAVDLENLRDTDRIEDDTLIALAVRIGRTRLIDNTIIRTGV